MRVLAQLSDETEQTVALLHDVVEDTDWTIEALRARGYSEEVLAALDALTRRRGESYEQFIERLRPNALARRVKLADLADNLDVRRLAEVTERDSSRLNRYLRAWRRLREVEPDH